ncbi:hypothetical protein [Glycomyces buryatensis]|uniref:Uncharacterized protein n=1 Tax=Glycomyces buryatensis TaxID=2570927 RepID=A0A4S8QL73_9ACTN|nr:hypothetical protein [Glycomyces buryatensis]THV41474.1 hypothetical protein FAB82_11805 [Glycomyces buryatensis]
MEEAAEYVKSLGITPPDSEAGWYVIVDYPPGYNGEPRLVWTRTLYSVIEPEDSGPSASESGDASAQPARWR